MTPLSARLAILLKLDLELNRWRRLGVRPRLWWRDDDVRCPSAALDRLLTLAAGRPLALAVIPDGDLASLAARLAAERNVCVGQHGVDHVNRRSASEQPSEYAVAPTESEIAVRVRLGCERLRQAGLTPCFYTPPWNAVDPGLGRAVSRAGIPLLSAGSRLVQYADLVALSTDADVTAWKRGPRFKGGLRIMSALQRALRERRRAGEFQRPVGILTHHLDHDEATWTFLGKSLPLFDRAFDWVSVGGALHLPAAVARGRAAAAGIDPMAQAQRV